MKTRKTKEQVERFLKRLIPLYLSAGRKRLPTVSTVAQRLGCSTVTVTKAISQLVQDGAIEARPGAGTIILAPGPQSTVRTPIAIPHTPQRARMRYEEIALDLKKGILRGTFADTQSMPGATLLAAEFGVSFRTIKKALHLLEASGDLEHTGGKYAPARGHLAPFGRRSIYLVFSQESVQAFCDIYIRGTQLCSALEKICIDKNLTLHTMSFKQAVKVLPASRESRKLLGAILVGTGLSTRQIETFLTLAPLKEVPVAIYDSIGRPELEPLVRQRRLHRIFRIAVAQQDGFVAGRHLLSLQHKRVACFTMSENIVWAARRLKGVESAFRKAGYRQALSLFTWNHFPLWEHLFNNPSQATLLRSRLIDPLAKALGDIHPRSSHYCATWLYEHVMRKLQTPFVYTEMEPLFETALKDRSISAWVCLTDIMAFAALEFLRNHAIRVPQQISVIGFDNTLEAIGSELTSYDFNVRGLATEMVRHILEPPARACHQKSPVEVPGFMVIRGSSAVAATQAGLASDR